MASQFFSDLEFPNQYYGVLIRSSIQRGKLVDIKQPTMPDGYYMYTATDIPGENKLTAMGTTVPIFTPYEIQYFGEPLGIIVGPDLEVVHELVSEVLIESEKQEPFAFEEKFTSAQILGKRVITRGDADTILAKAARVYESEREIGSQDHYYAEPLGVNVEITKEKLTIYTATQWPFHVRSTVSAALDLDPEEIIVTPTVLGESMDGKIWYPSLLAAQASLAAVLCKKPVKIFFSRQEDFLFSGKSAPTKIRYRTAISGNGNIEAMTARVLINAGAYNPLIDEIVDRVAVAVTGLYDIPAYRVEVFALKTNLPPMGALNGLGESQSFFALETHISSIISEIGASPIEWKMMNLLGKGKKTVTETEITEDLRFPELFSSICSQSDFPRKYTAYELLNKNRASLSDGALRGIGIAIGYQGNGFLGKPKDYNQYSVEITIDTGGQVQIKTGFYSPSMQQIFRTLTANRLGIEEDLIFFNGTDTTNITKGGPDTLSNKITILTPLLEKCCATIQKQRFRQPLPITVKKTYKPPKNVSSSDLVLTGTTFTSITPGACVLELELNPVTYETNVRGIWLSCNPGTLYSKSAAISTIRKTIPFALSKMSSEHILIKEGRFIPKDSIQYDMLNPAVTPHMSVQFLESEDAARGIGSIANDLVPAAYAAALGQIVGRQIESVPIDAKDIYEILTRPEVAQ
jgi:xanthine dehydrogenase large subunit